MGLDVAILLFFLHSELVVHCVFVDKQLISFQNCLIFSLDFTKEGFKWRFLISNISAGNVLPASYGFSDPAVAYSI
jgi:hypothetical protein